MTGTGTGPNVGPATVEKTLEAVAREWDAAAQQRESQISSGIDLSFHRVLVPAVLDFASNASWDEVLDVGCGTGALSQKIADRSRHVTAVDVSGTSIAIAQERHAAPNLRYMQTSVEDYAKRSKKPKFTLAVANMAIMTTPSLTPFVSAVAALLRPKSAFVLTMTHPWFWPLYWRYAGEPWFDYRREVAIEAPLRISLADGGVTTTHFHRPLAMYMKALAAQGFVIDRLDELSPSREDHDLYPEQWAYPRFVAIRGIRSP